jgi:hypothetical protein
MWQLSRMDPSGWGHEQDKLKLVPQKGLVRLQMWGMLQLAQASETRPTATTTGST